MKNLKKNLILILLLLVATSHNAYAIQEGKVISDSATQKEIMDSFNSVNQYTDSFFTPNIKKKVQKTYDAKYKPREPKTGGSTPPVKRLRLKIQDYYATEKDGSKKGSLKNKKEQLEQVPEMKDQAILDCDVMEYFAERTELEADGNVVMFFPENNSTIKADKVIYNQTSNLIKAFGHVVLINDGKEMFGDYMQIDMNEENAFLDNPETDIFQVRARAKKGYMYGDKIIQEQGDLFIKKKTIIDVKAEMFGPDLSTMYIDKNDKSSIIPKGQTHGEKFKIKTNELIINAKKEHDTVTVKHAQIFLNDKKIATLPTMTAHTNKNRDYVEGDFAEIGTVSNLGMYAGPGFVFDTPGGTTLKVLPILNYQSNGDNSEDNAFGYGAIAKFKSASNKTDFAYGTANKEFIMRGYQKLDDNLIFQYASNSYTDDWFMGFRIPRLMGELVYQDFYTTENFLGKEKDLTYTHRVALGYAQDGQINSKVPLGQDGIGTLRAKYMNEIAQTIYKFKDNKTSPYNARLEIVGQGAAAVYGTGDTQIIGRIGPRLHTQYKYWMQDAGYFLSTYQDNTPLKYYDGYVYGRSNAYVRESLRLCKYLTLSWFGSFNLTQDSWDGKMMQENTFFFAIGPDDIQLNIGYDTIRQQSFVTMAMNLDAKGTTVEYKKMTIKNPERLGKNEDERKNPQTSFSSAQNNNIDISNMQDDENVEYVDEKGMPIIDTIIDEDDEEAKLKNIQRAEVVDIAQQEAL